jgi:hypothetical protein
MRFRRAAIAWDYDERHIFLERAELAAIVRVIARSRTQ